MNKVLESPADQFAAQLELSDGAKIIAEVRGKTVYLTVIEVEKQGDKSSTSEENFAEKWAGKFSNLLETDLTYDPRAQAILNH